MADPVRAAPVSVVIPCYRCADTIERAIRSVAAQTLRPAELILIDDGSPDGTGTVLEQLRRRYGADWIRIISLPRNVGAASARNAGWDAATQAYVAFLDSDDAWHPGKVEIQWAWMEAHPEVAVSGHGARQLVSEAEIPADPGDGEAQFVSRRALYASNQFITPSVMLRRAIPQRFEAGKRYMEDYLLWLEIASSGNQIARLPQQLAFTFKAAYGEGGLSGQPWRMEKGELAAFTSLLRKGHLGIAVWLLLTAFSIVKFCRRLLMLASGYNPAVRTGRPSFLFPAAYLMLTQSMTALLIGAGLVGRSELAADIGIVQAATLATFFAFSGNARNLILSTRSLISTGSILAARLALIAPLGAAALLLCVAVARVELLLALILVVRRAVEWIGELALSESELKGDRSAAAAGLVLQSVLLFVALAVAAVAPTYTLWGILAWAVIPVVPALRFCASRLRRSSSSLREAFRILIPHYGSTVVTGASLYAFRVLLVLVAGKAAAGDLFVAFALGSFLGTIFANVLGPSISLHEERSGRMYLPRVLWTALILQLVAGMLVAGASFFAPAALTSTHLSILFWEALAWSLLGGVVMLIAQRGRVRLIANGQGDAVFGADVMIHVLLVATVPVLFATGSESRLSMLYAINAALALVFYMTSENGIASRLGPWASSRAAPALAFGIFFPMFFLITGALFNPVDAVWDSGGSLRNLPLPVSLLACYGGLLLLGRYGTASSGLWTILGLLVTMVFSSVFLSVSESAERAKMMLMLQILLPTFGLVLGEVIDPDGRRRVQIAVAVLAVVAFIVPAQLLATWWTGEPTLTHTIFAFSVYQHLQYVPVILVCGFIVALPEVWPVMGRTGKAALAALGALLAVYATAALSLLATFAAIAGALAFARRRLMAGRKLRAAGILATIVGSVAAYSLLSLDSDAFRAKFGFLISERSYPVVLACCGEHVKTRFGEWNIESKDSHGINILRLAPFDFHTRATVKVKGELQSGAFVILLEDKKGKTSALKARFDKPGPFDFEVEVDRNRGDGQVVLAQEGAGARLVIREMRWSPAATLAEDGTATTDEKTVRVPNVLERLADWRMFGRGIVESWPAFLFGHEKSMPREVRSSAHNFYIDFAYNFGVLALLPLLGLIFYTCKLMWRRRREIAASESLQMLAAVVLFLVLIDSNFKVTLRQPYPGIAAYFLWGLLLARLRAPVATSGKAG